MHHFGLPGFLVVGFMAFERRVGIKLLPKKADDASMDLNGLGRALVVLLVSTAWGGRVPGLPGSSSS